VLHLVGQLLILISDARNQNIKLKMFHFTNFSLTAVMLFTLLLFGVIFIRLLYMISFVDCLYVFALCSCAVSVIGLVAVAPAINNKELNCKE